LFRLKKMNPGKQDLKKKRLDAFTVPFIPAFF